MAARYEVRSASDGKLYFNLVAPNNEIILTSRRREGAEAISTLLGLARIASSFDQRFERHIASSGEPYFILVDAEGKAIGQSETYSSKQARESGIDAVRRYGPTADAVDRTDGRSLGGIDLLAPRAEAMELRTSSTTADASTTVLASEPTTSVWAGSSAGRAERQRLMDRVPGFRSKRPWKMAVASLGYLVVVSQALAGGLAGLMFAALALFTLAAYADINGLRAKTPGLRSESRAARATTWTLLGVGMLGVLGAGQPGQAGPSSQSPAHAPPVATERVEVTSFAAGNTPIETPARTVTPDAPTERAATIRPPTSTPTRTATAEPTSTPAPTTEPPTPLPVPPTEPPPPPPPVDHGGCVNLNTASWADLQQIIHIGPERADVIIGMRPFRSVAELDNISGIGPSRMADIRAQGIACVY